MSNDQLSINNYQLPEGYKQTEVGVIPEDWEISLLVNLAEIRSGIAKNSNNSVKNPVSVYYLRVANVQNGFLDLSEMSQLQVSHEDVKRYAVLPDDMLMNEGGDLDKLGRGTLWSGKFIPCIHQNHVFVVRCGSKLLPIYLNCWTGTRAAHRYFMTAGKQTTNLASINKTSLGQLPVAHPSDISEQRSIAQALSDVDALIASLDKLIAKKRHLKTATMQQLLTGKKRLPGFGEGKGYQKTEVGVIPEDWNVMSIQSALDEKYIEDQMDGNHGELYPRSHEFVSYGIPYIGANDFLNGRVTFKNCKFLSEERARKFKKGIARSGDVLFAHNATVGPVALLEFDGDFLILSTTATYFRCNLEKLNNLYFRFVLETQYFTKQYRAVMAQSTRFQVPITTQRKLLIGVAPIKEQREIATVLSDMDAEITALETRLAKTQSIKQGMMQQLLTGKVRLLGGIN